jgi:hypothetical protein
VNNIKIKISEFAYEELKKAFDQCPEFSFIRLAFSEGCSKSSKVEIILDNAKENDIKDKVDELPFLYDYHMASKVRELTIVYRDFSLQIKTELYEPITKVDSLTHKGCGKSSGCTSCSSCGGK